MGNEKSRPSKHSESKNSSSSPSTGADHRISTAFGRIGDGNVISYENLTTSFGEDLAESLWKYLSNNKPTSEPLSFEEFSEHAASLIGNSTIIYFAVLLPELHLIKVCSEAAGAAAVEGDQRFIAALVKTCENTTMPLTVWLQSHSPNFCKAVQYLVLDKFLGVEQQFSDYSSDLLTPLQMWFVQSSLPSCYFPQEKCSSDCHWTPLYSSFEQGISVNRFEKNVMDYRGPTVLIVSLSDGRTCVLANDHEWRHRTTRFGGSETVYMELLPKISHVMMNTSNSIYCNFQIRSAAFGLSFKDVMKIDKDMSNVANIEVWGCAGASTLAEQQKLKNWQNQQAERHKKLPLPGNWDDNPDKSLLEMAGFQFSNERKLMEDAKR